MREFEVPASYTIPDDANNSDNVFRFGEETPNTVLFNVPNGSGGWNDVTAAQFAKAVTGVAKGLIASGIELGDRVAIMAATRYEWTLLDFAIWAAGGVTVAIYDSSAAEQAKWILQDSETKLLVVENDKHRATIDEIEAGSLPALAETIQIDKGAVDTLTERGAELDDSVVHERRKQVGAASPATLIYTSGTTGRPKGVQLTHANLWAESRSGGIELSARDLRTIRRVKILGCGSAYYVGQMGAGLIEELARIPADAEAASEFRYRNPIIEPDTLYVVVSQSGETIDTLLAVQEIKRKGGRVLGVVNVVGSAIARAVDGGIYLHAGPEIAVASTKALTNMYVAFSLLALQLGRVRDLSIADGKRLIAGLQALPSQIEEILKSESHLEEVAARLAEAESMFFVGRVRGYPVAREGAQKLKEISYRHAEAYQTSELKHGPLALISESVPTVAIVPQDELTDRNVAALHEISARRGPLVVVTHPDVDLGELDALRVDVPKNEVELDPILLTIPLQLIAFHAAKALGHDVDKPRNLAKSVTVE